MVRWLRPLVAHGRDSGTGVLPSRARQRSIVRLGRHLSRARPEPRVFPRAGCPSTPSKAMRFGVTSTPGIWCVPTLPISAEIDGEARRATTSPGTGFRFGSSIDARWPPAVEFSGSTRSPMANPSVQRSVQWLRSQPDTSWHNLTRSPGPRDAVTRAPWHTWTQPDTTWHNLARSRANGSSPAGPISYPPEFARESPVWARSRIREGGVCNGVCN